MFDNPQPITRRDFLKWTGAAAAAGAAALAWPQRLLAQAAEKRLNVVMIALDDQNDWIGCLGGHPDVKTPHIDRLAKRGVLFTNAHSAATVCGPARVTVMYGVWPATSGIYNNGQPARWSAALKDVPTVAGQFKAAGYYTEMIGKVLNLTDPDPESWDKFPKRRWEQIQRQQQQKKGAAVGDGDARLWDGVPKHAVPVGQEPAGPPEDPNRISVYRETTGACRFFEVEHNKPFFLAIGLTGTHAGVARATKKYFDMYPLDDIHLPEVKEDDLADLPGPIAAQQARGPFRKIKESGQWRKRVQGYLAAVSFQDAQVGRILDAINVSAYAKNTLIVLWSDQGFHIGSKNQYGKSTLWEENTRIPLIFAAPGIAPGVCDRCVSLIDVYPTLDDLCGLPKPPHLQGHSLMPLLENPKAEWDRPAFTSRDPGRHSVRTNRWRYTRYDGIGEELYDHDNDPNEWHNLADDPKYADVKAKLAAMLPKNAAPVPQRPEGAADGGEDD